MALQTFTTGQVLTAAQVTALQSNDYNQTVSTKTVSYVLVAADVGTRVVMNAAGATTITVNTALFAAGDTLQILNIGVGVSTITAGTATVSTSSVLALSQYDAGTLYFTSTGVSIWMMVDAADTSAAAAGTLTGATLASNVLASSLTSFGTTPTLTTPKITTYTTNGDLVYGTGSSVITRLGIGSTSQVLTVTGGVPVWATPTSGGMTLLSTTSLTGATTTVSSIDQTYVHLYFLLENCYGSIDSQAYVLMNGDTTTANYSGSSIRNYSGTTTNLNFETYSVDGSGIDNSASANQLTGTIYNYVNATFHSVSYYYSIKTDIPGFGGGFGVMSHNGTSAITSLGFKVGAGTWSAGTVKIYGVK